MSGEPLDDGDRWMPTREAVAYTGLSVATLTRLAKAGKLKPGRTPGKRLWRKSALDKLLEAGPGSWLAVAVVAVLFALYGFGSFVGALELEQDVEQAVARSGDALVDASREHGEHRGRAATLAAQVSALPRVGQPRGRRR